jgi:hypothetical protein
MCVLPWSVEQITLTRASQDPGGIRSRLEGELLEVAERLPHAVPAKEIPRSRERSLHSSTVDAEELASEISSRSELDLGLDREVAYPAAGGSPGAPGL